MNDKVKVALDWALNQPWTSVASRHARTLAEHIDEQRKVPPHTPLQKKEEGYTRSELVKLQELYYEFYADDSLVGFLEWLREREENEL